MGLEKSKNVEKMYVLGTSFFDFLFDTFNCFCENVITYFENIFCGDEDRKMINLPLIKCTKAWI